jgi:hypothetical protein
VKFPEEDLALTLYRLRRYEGSYSRDRQSLVIEWHLADGESFSVAVPRGELPRLRELIREAERTLNEPKT